MSEWLCLYSCYKCGYELRTRINQQYKCPACQAAGDDQKMGFVTTEKED